MAVTITAESLLTIPPQSSGLQTVGLFILFFLPALALVIVITRCAGRFATGQFGWGEWPRHLPFAAIADLRFSQTTA